LVILNEDTFEEIFSLKLNECFVVATIGAIFLISVTTFISFYPFKEFIPGYSSSKLKDATVLALKSDSLTIALKKMMPIYNPFKSTQWRARIRKI
jgi:hypothetical protein